MVANEHARTDIRNAIRKSGRNYSGERCGHETRVKFAEESMMKRKMTTAMCADALEPVHARPDG